MTSSVVKTVYYDIHTDIQTGNRSFREIGSRPPPEIRQLSRRGYRRHNNMAESRSLVLKLPPSTGNRNNRLSSSCSTPVTDSEPENQLRQSSRPEVENKTGNGIEKEDGTSLGFNTQELCRLADVQFADRMKFDRGIQATVNGNGGRNDVRPAAIKTTGSIRANGIKPDKENNCSASISHNTDPRNSQLDVDIPDEPTKPEITTETSMTSLNDKQHTEITENDVMVDDDVPHVSAEITSLSSATTQRSILSLYNLRVWPELDGPNDAGKQYPIRRPDGSGRARNSASDQTRKQTVHHENSGSTDRIRTIRSSYPDDPSLRRILCVGLQLNGGSNVHNSQRNACHVPHSSQGPRLARTAPREMSVNEPRVRRSPSVTLMLERSVTKIEPGWKKNDLDSAAGGRRRGRPTVDDVTVLVEDDVDDEEEATRKQRNCSSVASSRTATTSFTPRPPCNSPDQSRDDYFWPTIASSAYCFRSSAARKDAEDRLRPTAAAILSHYEQRKTNVERFHHRQKQLASSKLATKEPSEGQTYLRGCVSGSTIRIDTARLQTPSRLSSGWSIKPETGVTSSLDDVVGNNDVKPSGTRQLEVTSKPPPRLVVYVPH